MRIKTAIALATVLLMLSCQSSKDKINYKSISEQFTSIQNTFNEKAKTLKSKKIQM